LVIAYVVIVVEYEFKKKMNKKEMVGFLRTLADEIEKGSAITSPEMKKLPINNPVFTVDYEYMEKEYGKKLKIDIKMKEYD
jgi:hypothetical protein